MNPRIIDPINDTNYPEEVRTLLGVTSDELTDTVLKLDIILGMAERMVCGYVNNWKDILNGSDVMAEEALRSCIILKVALNIINMPATQNLLIDEARLPNEIAFISKKVGIDEIKKSLQKLFEQQLALVGVEHTGNYPEKEIIGASTSMTFYDYYIDTSGVIQEN